LPEEPRRLALAAGGLRKPLYWTNAETEMLDFLDLKGMVEVLLERLGLSGQVSFVPLSDDERLHPGRAARLLFAPQQANGKAAKAQQNTVLLGVMGELHPTVQERLEVPVPRSVAAELDLDALLSLVQPRDYRLISRYPASKTDLAFVVEGDISAEQVAAIIRRGAGDLLESLTLFDIYTGPQVGEGKRSLAYRLAFRAPDRTLTDDDLAKIRAKIARLLEREVGAAMRG
jgi:phenylalanyl-tRNA synthetase beta chain